MDKKKGKKYMITPQDVYIAYQQARARYCNRPYRIPDNKNWDKIWSKLTEKQTYNVEMLSVAFSTRWQNIVPSKYFDTGFKLFGNSFSYAKFYDRRILTEYINQDKQQKRKDTNVQVEMTNSFSFIDEWMKENRQYRDDITLYSQYCRMKDDGIRAPIKHYLNNNIDKHTLAWLISKKYLILQDNERGLIPLVIENYWTLSEESIKCIKGE